MKRKILILLISLILLVLLSGLTSALLYTGVIHINNPSRSKYPVRGVDVSHHQGEVDWDKLSKEDISFAFIKATEGSKYKDEQFDRNWSKAAATDLRIGAYHFFSLDSPGADQAENFCNTVGAVKDMLPPVVDVEPYGNYQDPGQLDKEKMLAELSDFLVGVESYYGLKPILQQTGPFGSIPTGMCSPGIQEQSGIST
jgi:lysozyme